MNEDVDECEREQYYWDDCELCGLTIEVRVGSSIDRGDASVLCDDCFWDDEDDD